MSNDAQLASTQADRKIAHGNHAEQSASNGHPNVFSEYIAATYNSSVGRPLHSLAQLAGRNTNEEHTPELHGAMKAAESLGTATGQILDFAILSKACGGALNRIGATKLLEATALHQGVTAATIGFIDGAVLTPVDDGSGGLRRIGNGVVEAGAFGAMGLVSSKGKASFGESFTGHLKSNALAGAMGGAVHAQLDAAVHGQKATGSEIMESAASWAISNMAMGSASTKLHSFSESKEVKVFHTDASPKLRSLFEPRPITGRITERGSDSIEYEIRGTDVAFKLPQYAHSEFNLPRQVRLENGTGFVVDGSETATLREFPQEIAGLGTLEYKPHSTVLTTPEGTFERTLWGNGLTTTMTPSGEKVQLRDNGVMELTRRNMDRAYFENGRLTSVTEGSGASGSAWSFNTDGSFQMRSLPSGKYRIHVDADGQGESIFIAGTSRSIGGRVRGSNHLPLDKYSDPVSYDRETGIATGFNMPNMQPVEESFLQKLHAAQELLKGLAS